MPRCLMMHMKILQSLKKSQIQQASGPEHVYEISHRGNIYTMDVDRCYKSGFPSPGAAVSIYQRSTVQRICTAA